MGDSLFEALSPLGPELGFAALLFLFAASLLIVLAWLLQVTRGSPSPPPGTRSLLRALCSFPSIRESWSKAWAQALNREAVRSQSSVQMRFEENIPLQPNVHINQVTCTKHSDSSMVLLCSFYADTVTFPISVTQESPAAVSCDTYRVSLTIQQAQIEVQLQELPQEGLLVSWGFKDRPDIMLQIEPKHSYQGEGGAELCTVQDLIQNALLTAEPAMMFNLKAHDGDTGSYDRLLPSFPSRTEGFRLLIRQLRLQDMILPDMDVELMCEAELDHPCQRRNTRSVRVQKKGEICNASWTEEMTFDLSSQSSELSLKVWQIFRSADKILLGHTLVALGTPHKELCGRHLYPLIPSSLFSKPAAPAISVEFHIPEASLTRDTLGTSTQRINVTPTKKVEMDRTVMPDGTIVTTVTTIQSRLKLDGRIDSPARSPSKVEVTENKPVIFPRSGSPGSSSSSGGSPASIMLDPVAETAIRQLTEPGNKPNKRTPTKRSTLIISGVSKVPVGEDEMALSLGYAASMDATLQGTSTCFQESLLDASPYFSSEVTTSLGQDADDTTRSDISDRPSLDDLDSDTGSTGALETCSLKDHKVGFLRSGTKLLFHWHHRDAGLSQSHDDLRNSTTSSRKKRGSFPRRLLKHFSLKTKSKPSVNGGTQAGDK
ncbi:phospholipid transfer protein C2CD2L isoform X2 [Mixophyes fleayi]|uniref:phospholipid transfer protein C2CD2L isoform X2 n=1 Tax=Mixophyes fleayi TaxID=3061075 RepID=UPI003F4DD694